MNKIFVLINFMIINQTFCYAGTETQLSMQGQTHNDQEIKKKQDRKIIVNEILDNNGSTKVVVSQIGNDFPIDLQQGDIIESVNGENISSIYQLRQILKNINNRDYKLILAISRNHTKMTLTVSNKQSIDKLTGSINRIKQSTTQSEEINNGWKTTSESSRTTISNNTSDDNKYSVEDRFDKRVLNNSDGNSQIIYSRNIQVGNFKSLGNDVGTYAYETVAYEGAHDHKQGSVHAYDSKHENENEHEHDGKILDSVNMQDDFLDEIDIENQSSSDINSKWKVPA